MDNSVALVAITAMLASFALPLVLVAVILYYKHRKTPGGASLLQGFRDLMQLRALTSEAIGGLAMSTALLVSAIILAMDTD